jgi:hypothetical protein
VLSFVRLQLHKNLVISLTTARIDLIPTVPYFDASVAFINIAVTPPSSCSPIEQSTET